MTTVSTGEAIERALRAARLSQRTLAEETGISQPTLSRIISGHRVAKMTEIIQIAAATGVTVAYLTGTAAEERVQYAARVTNGSSAETLRRHLLGFIELDAYLDDQAISAPR